MRINDCGLGVLLFVLHHVKALEEAGAEAEHDDEEEGGGEITHGGLLLRHSHVNASLLRIIILESYLGSVVAIVGGAFARWAEGLERFLEGNGVLLLEWRDRGWR